jgi:hypothetical protein
MELKMIVDKKTLHPNLSTRETHYYTENTSAPVKDVMNYVPDVRHLAQSLAKIPHLRLKIPPFNYQKAIDEVQPLLTDIVNCNLRRPDESELLGPDYQPYWAGRAIVNYSASSTEFFCKQAKESSTQLYPHLQEAALDSGNERLTVTDMKYYKTEIYNQLPYITDFISRYISQNTYRCWIWVIKKNGYLNWHNHGRLPWHNDFILYDKAIVHLPLITSPKSLMLVKKSDIIYGQHYAPGESWLFNPVEDHAVDNSRNPNDRIHITVFCPLDDPVFLNLAKTSLTNSNDYEVML